MLVLNDVININKKVYAKELELYDAGVTPGPKLEVKAKFAAADSARSANAAAAQAASDACAAEVVRAQAAEAGNAALNAAEVARAGAAEAHKADAVTLEAALDTRRRQVLPSGVTLPHAAPY